MRIDEIADPGLHERPVELVGALEVAGRRGQSPSSRTSKSRDPALLLEHPRGALGVRHGELEVLAVATAQLVVADLLEQTPLVDDADTRGELLDLGEDVARQEHGDAALRRQPLQDLADVRDARRGRARSSARRG